MLLANAAAALTGPSIVLGLRSRSENDAMHDLVAKTDPARFQQTFSSGVDDAQALIEVSGRPSGHIWNILSVAVFGVVIMTLDMISSGTKALGRTRE